MIFRLAFLFRLALRDFWICEFRSTMDFESYVFALFNDSIVTYMSDLGRRLNHDERAFLWDAALSTADTDFSSEVETSESDTFISLAEG